MIIGLFVSSLFSIDDSNHCEEISYTDISIYSELRIKQFIIKHEGHVRNSAITVADDRFDSRHKVVSFLKRRLEAFQKHLKEEQLYFCCKGSTKLLGEAGIKNIIKSDYCGIPATSWLLYLYPETILFADSTSCPFHFFKKSKRCTALNAVLILEFIKNNEDLFGSKCQKRGINFFLVDVEYGLNYLKFTRSHYKNKKREIFYLPRYFAENDGD